MCITKHYAIVLGSAKIQGELCIMFTILRQDALEQNA